MSRIATTKSERRSKVTRRKMRSNRASSSGVFISNLPSGESLAEFALRYGFLTPSLFGKERKDLVRPRGIL